MELTRDAILKKSADLPRELVEVPEWGGSVWVRTMTGAERGLYDLRMFEAPDTRNFRALIAALCVCDETGQRTFSEADVDMIAVLASTALDRVYAVAARLNKLRAEDVKELEKN